jgi:hypothetical protein
MAQLTAKQSELAATGLRAILERWDDDGLSWKHPSERLVFRIWFLVG